MISIETLRTHRHSRAAILADPDILLIRRGYRVRLHGDQDARPWEIWQSINIARLHALDYQFVAALVLLVTAHTSPWNPNMVDQLLCRGVAK